MWVPEGSESAPMREGSRYNPLSTSAGTGQRAGTSQKLYIWREKNITGTMHCKALTGNKRHKA
eukprot:1741943-Heterocapsa_arctica.AAC.1